MLMQFFPSSVSCLAEMKDSLYHAKHMFHFGTNREFRMFDCLEQLELFAACLDFRISPMVRILKRGMLPLQDGSP